MTQVVYENLSFQQLERNLEEIFASGYSVSLFTDWQWHQEQVRREEPGSGFGEGVLRGNRGDAAAASTRGNNCRELHGADGDPGAVV